MALNVPSYIDYHFTVWSQFVRAVHSDPLLNAYLFLPVKTPGPGSDLHILGMFTLFFPYTNLRQAFPKGYNTLSHIVSAAPQLIRVST